MNIRIDPEFKDFLGPLDEDARQALEASLRAGGCRDALVVWPQPDGDPILIDGHNRREICGRHGIAFRTVDCPDSVTDRASAVAWIVENQRARRNLSPDRLAYLIGKSQQIAKRELGGNGSNQHTEQRCQNGTFARKTAEKVAREFGVSPRTVYRNANFAEQVDAIAAKHGPEAKAEILTGRKKVSDFKPNPEPEPPIEEEAPLDPAPEPKSGPTTATPASDAASDAPSVHEPSTASALPEDDPLRGWDRQTDSDHVQWMAKNLKATADGGLRPGAVHFGDTVSENLVDPEQAQRFANSWKNHLCQLEHHAAMLPSAVENDELDAERRESLKTRLSRLVDALQTFSAAL